jgi:hypothetical protein
VSQSVAVRCLSLPVAIVTYSVNEPYWESLKTVISKGGKCLFEVLIFEVGIASTVCVSLSSRTMDKEVLMQSSDLV